MFGLAHRHVGVAQQVMGVVAFADDGGGDAGTDVDLDCLRFAGDGDSACFQCRPHAFGQDDASCGISAGEQAGELLSTVAGEQCGV